MKIKSKLYALLASGFLLVALVGSVMFVANRDITADGQAIQATEQLMRSAGELRMLGLETILLHEARAADQWQRKTRSIYGELQAFEIVQPAARATLERIRKYIKAANAIYADLQPRPAPAANATPANTAEEAAFVARNFADLTLVIQDAIDSAIDLNRASRQHEAESRRVITIAVALMLLAMLAQLAFMWHLTRSSILRPLTTFVGATQRIAAGDYSVRLHLPERDEIGTLASAFNAMSMKVQQTDQAIRLEQDNLSVTLHSIGDAVIATDAQGCITRMNPVAERLTGWPLADALGQPLTAVFHIISAETRLPSVNPVQLVMERGEVVGLANHTVLLARDGQEYQIADSAAPIRNAADQIVGVVLVFSDVTEKYRTELARRLIEQRFSDLVNSTDGIVWEADATTFDFVFVSPNAERLFGYKTADWLQPGFWASRIHPDDRGQAVAFCEAQTQRLEDHDLEYRFITADDRTVWLRAQVTVVAEEGKPHWLRGLMIDITAEKEATATLTASENRWKFAIEGADDGLWDWDVPSHTVFFSSRWKSMLGFEDNEVGNGLDEWSKRVHPADLVKAMADVQSHLAGTTPQYVNEHRVLCKDGGWKWILARGLVIARDASGAPLRMIGTHTDITERKRAEEERAALEEQLRESQKMQAIGTLAGGIAHDFNNILATIHANTKLALEDSATNPRAIESLAEIDKAATRASNLVRQIVSFSRRQATTLTTISLVPVVEESARFLRATLPPRLSLRLDIAKDLPNVTADATQIEQVLINLATNAMQAMREGRGQIDIILDTVVLDEAYAVAHPQAHTMVTAHPGRTVRLMVRDNGPGMNAATQARVFEPFFTTKPIGEGTGLGLAVVHGIVQKHEGVIILESELGKGTAFTFLLPASADRTTTHPGVATAEPSLQLNGGRHILYLDDDEALAFVFGRLLKRRGYRVTTFIHQNEALAALKADPCAFDLLVTDYNMPGASGLDVARAALAIRPDLPIAIASGFFDETLQADAVEVGVLELILKATDVNEFCKTVDRLANKVIMGSDTI